MVRTSMLIKCSKILVTFIFLKDGLNIVTINLPERLKKVKEQPPKEVIKKDKRPVSAYVSMVSSEESRSSEEASDEIYSPLIRDYSIDVWNGSPG